MAGPSIPYVALPELPLGILGDILSKIPLLGDIFSGQRASIKPFGALVTLGVYIGSIVAVRHARERHAAVVARVAGARPQLVELAIELRQRQMNSYILWIVGIGFIGGHVFDAIFYHPDRLSYDPLYIIKLWDGLSSYGGFLGAIIGAFSWRYRFKENILGFSEAVNSAFPLAWVFGRAGCSVVHDHPGRFSSSFLAVCYPSGVEPPSWLNWCNDSFKWVGRFDLGFLEFLLTIPLAAAFLLLWRRSPHRPLGFYTGWMCVLYAPVRFVLDFLRDTHDVGGDPRYGGLTPAQYASVGLLLAGVWYLRAANDPEKQRALDEEQEKLAREALDQAASIHAAQAADADDAPAPAADRPRKRRSRAASKKGVKGGKPRIS